MTEKKQKKAKDKKLAKILKKIKSKRKPTFRGRFGKKNIRRKSIEKWQKWRKPRGIDASRKKEDGNLPNRGYRTDRSIRHLHPSGVMEARVENKRDLENVKQGYAARIASAVGKKKRAEIIRMADELGVRVLNRKV